MGILDIVKGLLGGETLQNALEPTGLNEHVEGLLGQGTAVAESLGVDVDQVTETIGGGVGEMLPSGLDDSHVHRS